MPGDYSETSTTTVHSGVLIPPPALRTLPIPHPLIPQAILGPVHSVLKFSFFNSTLDYILHPTPLYSTPLLTFTVLAGVPGVAQVYIIIQNILITPTAYPHLVLNHDISWNVRHALPVEFRKF